jgi:hypothetical protein
VPQSHVACFYYLSIKKIWFSIKYKIYHRFHIFWHVTLCCYTSSSWHFTHFTLWDIHQNQLHSVRCTNETSFCEMYEQKKLHSVSCTTEQLHSVSCKTERASFWDIWQKQLHSVRHMTETPSFCELYHQISFWAVSSITESQVKFCWFPASSLRFKHSRSQRTVTKWTSSLPSIEVPLNTCVNKSYFVNK